MASEKVVDGDGGPDPMHWSVANGSRRLSQSGSRRLSGSTYAQGVTSSLRSLSANVGGTWGLIGAVDNPLERRSNAHHDDAMDDEEALKWAAVERLPTYDRVRTSIFHKASGSIKQVDVRELTPLETSELLNKLMQETQDENNVLLLKMRKRLDKYATLPPKPYKLSSFLPPSAIGNMQAYTN